MKLCACNKCEHLYEDTNPQVGAVDYTDLPVMRLELLKDEDHIPADQSAVDWEIHWYQGCPICKTDGYLTDDINYIASLPANKKMIEEVIDTFQFPAEWEEGSTSRSEIDKLIQLYKSI